MPLSPGLGISPPFNLGPLVAGGGYTGPTVDSAAQTVTAGFTDSDSVTMPAIAAGDVVLVQITQTFHNAAVVSCTSPNLTFTKIADNPNPDGSGFGGNCHAVYYAVAAEALTNEVITGTNSGGYGFGMGAFTVNGANASPLDPNSSLPATSLTATVGLSTTDKPDLVVLFYGDSSSSNAIVPPAGFTQIYNVAGAQENTFLAAYQKASGQISGGSYTFTGPTSSPSIIGVALKV